MKINKSSSRLRCATAWQAALRSAVAPQLRDESGFTLRKARERASAFTLIELLVAIGIIIILAALVGAGLNAALNRAQMNGTMNNARQIYLAQFQMSNDGAATADASSAWPGDLINGNYLPAGNLNAYANILLARGYMKGGDWLKLLNASGANFRATVTAGNPDTIAFTGGTAALKVYPCIENDPPNAVFTVTHNYIYDTALGTAGIPYGTKGFVVVRKGGDAIVFKAGQATTAGWKNNGTVFQTQVGYKTGDVPGTPTAGEAVGYLHYN